MFGVRLKLTLSRCCSEVGNLSKAKVEWKIFVFVLHRKHHVAAIVLTYFPEIKVLLVYFKVRVHRSSHHLYFQILVIHSLTVIAKCHNRNTGIVFRQDSKLIWCSLATSQGRTDIVTAACMRSSHIVLTDWSRTWLIYSVTWQVGEPSNVFVFLSAANKLQWDLFVGLDYATQREDCKNPLGHFLSDLGWWYKVVLLIWGAFIFKISQTFEKFKLKMGGLRTVVDQESRVFASFTHVQRSKI